MYRHGEEEIAAVARVLRSGQWFRFGEPKNGHMQEAATFERDWARTLGVPHALFTTSGTAALMSCYAALGMGPGDEVIIPGYTFIATAFAPLAMGVIPVIVDVDDSMMIDPAAVERAITKRTRAICPVHMNGFACDMDRILKIAAKHKLHVIEDACQCVGGYWNDGRRLGSLGIVGAFSFNYYKVLSCGDGGAMVAREKVNFDRARFFSDGGSIFRDDADQLEAEPFCGINLRGNEILAAIMRVQLSRLDGILKDLRRNRQIILERIAEAPGLQPIPLNGGSSTGTGATLGLKFENEEQARGFCSRLNATKCGAAGSLPIDSGRHVYSNWTPILDKAGASHPGRDAFKLNPTAPDYRADSLPLTLERLRRTVFIGISPEWSEAVSGRIAEAIRASAKELARQTS
jgi:dTDP-4-amino-4,6-dideoxygalactose transaminase